MMINKTILLTGATGFVGKALVSALHTKELRLLSRKDPQQTQGIFCQAEIDSSADYSAYLHNVDVVIHTAARVHVMDESSSDPLSAFREVNTAGTANLARQAAASGVKRFIFVSSVKVNGESTTNKKPFRYDDIPAPEDAYGLSKKEAEEELWEICNGTQMELVIIRPPLVYGPGVKANFAAMMKLAQKNLPLPFGSIHNKRSLVALDNLVDLILTCVSHPKAANQTFLVSDDEDLSTTELLEKMTRAAGKKPWLLPFPVSLMIGVAVILKRKAITDRLFGTLQVDIQHTKDTLSWKPILNVDQALKACLHLSVLKAKKN
ncbi:UDP-glucose 4-epimerase family protein [Rheinheimera mangrovi]|uniref:UDP-glucose 4-epimerase family protein n=1 Tax=Rheinheimera mangrovi TaxID=2498451 RepID=UPI001E465793|nr:SDR family oxidoreductase [Rheinheimera mangrovi]